MLPFELNFLTDLNVSHVSHTSHRLGSIASHIPDNICGSQTSARDNDSMRRSLQLGGFLELFGLFGELLKELWQLLEISRLLPRCGVCYRDGWFFFRQLRLDTIILGLDTNVKCKGPPAQPDSSRTQIWWSFAPDSLREVGGPWLQLPGSRRLPYPASSHPAGTQPCASSVSHPHR